MNDAPSRPDPTTDRYSAFDETEQPGAAPPAPSAVGPTPPGKSPRRVGLIFVVVSIALIGAPLFLAAVIALVTSSSGSSNGTDADDREAVAFTPQSVEPSTVPPIPPAVTSLRVELQGPDRIADVRLYSSSKSTTLDSTGLPFAATIPVDSDDAYVSVSADDYGYRGAQPMRCTISVGDVVLATAVGTKSVDCKVTDSTWQRER